MAPSTPSAHTRQAVAERRRQILDEAQSLIGERGYHGFGLQELASRCGLTKAGLLHHFGSKEQLLIALLRARDAENEAEVVALLEQVDDAACNPVDMRRRLMLALRTIVARNATLPELMRLQIALRAEAINPDHPAHAYFLARETAKRQVIAERVHPFCSEAQAVARRVLGIITGLEEQWLRESGNFDLQAECVRALELLVPAAPASPLPHPEVAA